MPTGSDAQTAEAYYDLLTANALHEIAAPRTDILWTGPLWMALFATILIGFFMCYSLWFQHRTLRHDELYGAISFAGIEFERIGRIPTFEALIWAFVAVWAIFTMVTQAVGGLYY
jgi:hypothetical protein